MATAGTSCTLAPAPAVDDLRRRLPGLDVRRYDDGDARRRIGLAYRVISPRGPGLIALAAAIRSALPPGVSAPA